MKLILVGCEYSGTTTLALGIDGWLKGLTGDGFRLIHDHWKIPHTSGHLPGDTVNFLTAEEQGQVLGLSPKLKEMHQRHSLYYHTPNFPTDGNKLMIGYTIDDAVYGQMYFEYGRPTDPQDRRLVAPQVEKTMLRHDPDTVMVLLRADPDEIRRRMKAEPRENGVLHEEDIEHAVERFDQEFKYSLVSSKVTLDTTSSTPEDTLAEFTEKIRPYLSDVDRSRIIAHKALGEG
jgi:hypothetical protein